MNKDILNMNEYVIFAVLEKGVSTICAVTDLSDGDTVTAPIYQILELLRDRCLQSDKLYIIHIPCRLGTGRHFVAK